MIKDQQGVDHMVISDKDFYNDDIMGDKFEDYEILQVIGNNPYGIALKVRSKINSKLYAMKKISSLFIKKENENQIKQEFEILKKMNNLNVTRYFKYFFQNNCLYIIYEYADNNDLYGFFDSYKSLNKPIEEKTLWNIFMQCISGLKYIHNNKIIHKNINLKNIFLTESKIVKLGDFRFSCLANNNIVINDLKREYLSPEINNNNFHYDDKTDIYALGIVFFKLCHFDSPNSQLENINIYSNEMENIIQLMLSNVNQRPDADTLYNLVKNEYIKNVAKISSINSIFRCMYAFINFSKEIVQKAQIYSNENFTPISYNLIKCFQIINNNGNQKDISIYLDNFRNLLYENNQINNDIEINPSLILEYLLEKLNKETANDFDGPPFGIQPISFNEDKENLYQQYRTYFNQNPSIITNYFLSFIKIKRICRTCMYGIYSFRVYPYLEFDLEVCGQNTNLQNWFYNQKEHNKILEMSHYVSCPRCQCIREHNEFKQFYILPQYLIISINRGEGYKNEAYIDIPMNLNLQGNIERTDSPILYNLVGIVKRKKDDKDKEYYISKYYDPYLNSWVLSDRNNLMKIQNPLENDGGMVMVLFYSSINNNNMGI